MKKIDFNLPLLEKLDELNGIASREDDAGWPIAANEILKLMGETSYHVGNIEEAKEVGKAYFYGLLDNDQYAEAASFTWGFNRFDPRPECVRDIFRTLPLYSRMAIQGASGVSKSYSVGLWLLLDWARDAFNTTVRCAAVNKTHLKSNLFTHFVRLHGESLVKLPGSSDRELWIGVDTKRGDGCIEGVIFPADQLSTGRFRGFKINPRPQGKPHPQFGRMTRIRVFLDESSEMTPGVFKDLSSVESQIDGAENVKIIEAYNPTDTTHITFKIAEPENGWDTVDEESSYEWRTKMGWWLLRLDALHCENVIHGKTIFPGLQTKEGFNTYLQKGDRSADYHTFGRGWFPTDGSYNSIFTLDMLNAARGEAEYIGPVVECGSIDVAFVNDEVVLTKGRYGEAGAMTLPNGQRVVFADKENAPTTRWILQVESQLQIPKQRDGYELAQKVAEICRSLKIQPQWFITDKSGNGIDFFNMLTRIYGDVLGIVWSEGATDIRALADDVETGQHYYSHVATEMWFTTKRWVENGILLIHPNVPRHPLFDELSARRHRRDGTKSGKICVESKPEYRARGNPSPDAADSCIMLSHLIRVRHNVLPGMSRIASVSKPRPSFNPFTQQEEAMTPKIDAVEGFDELATDENFAQVAESMASYD